MAELNKQYNAMVQDEQVKLAKSQTLERYIEKGKTWVDSLQNQAATQMVLINNSRLSVQPVRDEEWRIICALGGVEP